MYPVCAQGKQDCRASALPACLCVCMEVSHASCMYVRASVSGLSVSATNSADAGMTLHLTGSTLHYAGAHADRWHTLVAANWQVSMAAHLLGLLLEGLLSDVLARRRYLLELAFLLSRGRRHIRLHPPKRSRKRLSFTTCKLTLSLCAL